MSWDSRPNIHGEFPHSRNELAFVNEDDENYPRTSSKLGYCIFTLLAIILLVSIVI
jgi:hypothetical protein